MGLPLTFFSDSDCFVFFGIVLHEMIFFFCMELQEAAQDEATDWESLMGGGETMCTHSTG